ncbi:hypothetical protein J43TS9_51250 [Paenibacillus cineris]|nr:hypothetical protein J43TS9_51250 [Paenibacillus cineris]
MERHIMEKTEFGYRIRPASPKQESIRDWAAIAIVIAGIFAIITIL